MAQKLVFPGSLHNHSDYSNARLRDSTNTVKSLMDQAIKLNHQVLAYTEHEIVANAIKIEKEYAKVKQEHPDFKVIRGNEIYLVRNGLAQDNYIAGEDQYYHFILLAKDDIGHKQIRELSTRAWMRSWMQGRMRRVPTYYQDIEEIIGKNPGHVIGSSACLGGCIPQQLLKYRSSLDPERYAAIVKKIEYFKQVFSDDHFYLELQPSIQQDQLYTNPELLKLSKKLNVPCIITTDSHYLSKEEAPIHAAYLNAQDGDREVASFYSTAYMMDDKELRGYIEDYISEDDIQSMYSNILKIKDMCEDYTLQKPLRIPSLKWIIPEDRTIGEEWYERIPKLRTFAQSDFDGDRLLAETIVSVLKKRNDLCYQASYDEINSNLDMIWVSSEVNKAHWSAYLLNIQNIIDTCWRAGSIVGPGRGSGVGFYLLYILGITQINPLRETTKTFAWRFLNPERVSVLDIDFDVSGLRRAQILDKFREEYGEDRVANVATFGTEKSKAAILTAARGLGIDVDEAQYLASMVPSDRGMARTLKQCYYGDEENGFEPVKDFVREMDKNYQELWQVAQKIEGLVCRIGVHAGGVIFVDEPFTESTALMRAPDSTIITQFDLHDAEDASLIKYDTLSVEAIDKIQICLDLLCKYGYVEKKSTLKETYESVLGIYSLERKAPEMWHMVWEHKIQSLFQMEKQSGVQGIALTHPESVDDLAVLNSVIRLMAQEKGGEQPLNKYARFKKDISLWYKEMRDYGLTEEEQNVLKPVVGLSYGIADSQEKFMQLVQLPECGGFNLNFADRLRKSIAKKNPAEYLKLEKEYFQTVEEKGLSKNLCNYVWNVLIAMSRGYGFNASHTLAYSLVALQEMNLAYKYPMIFWDCACLIVNAGGEQASADNSKDYNKIAQALGKAAESGVKILPPDINKSDFTFTPIPENNSIVYGLSGINKIGLNLVPNIIENRPYLSLVDFMNKTALNRAQIIELIKAGAFNEFGSQEENMVSYLWLTCDKKKRLTLQNMPGLIKYNLLPQDEEYTIPRKIYEFNRYLKDCCKVKDGYRLDMRGIEFLNSLELESLYDDNFFIATKSWDNVYQSYMDKYRTWIAGDKENILDNLNTAIFMQEWEDKAKGNVSAWEMESICFYHHAHELINVNMSKYGLVDFSKLPEVPIVDKTFRKAGREIPLFKIFKIAGTVIAKNKAKYTIYLLTTTGVVPVKFRKEYFSLFDRQISQKDEEGKKRVIERSWFNRGNKLVIQGFRRENEFVAKKYAATAGHTLYKIKNVSDDGSIELISERAKGDEDNGEN